MTEWRDIVRKPKNWVMGIIALAVLIALIQSFFSAANSNLPAYIESPTPVPTTTPPNIDTVIYHNDEVNFSMCVPAGWSHVTKSGNDAFINQADGAMLMIDVHDYDPWLNTVTQESVQADVKAQNGMLGGFAQNDSHSYIVIYEVGTVDYFEYYCWDLAHTLCVSMSIPTERYQHYYDSVIYLFDTIRWEEEYPIPDDFYLYYSDYGNFEFGLPIGWQTALQDGSLVATSPNGSMVVVTLTSTSNDLSSISQLDYANLASAGKSNYLLSKFENNGTNLIAEASFQVNGTSCSEVRMMLSSGNFWYEFDFTCPDSAYDVDGAAFLQTINLFRAF